MIAVSGLSVIKFQCSMYRSLRLNPSFNRSTITGTSSVRPIRLFLHSEFECLEVTVCDGLASVLRAQMVFGSPSVQLHWQSSPTLVSLDVVWSLSSFGRLAAG
eukprot:symbB.v1.2.008477.t1/scaffold534.1/size190675/8